MTNSPNEQPNTGPNTKPDTGTADDVPAKRSSRIPFWYIIVSAIIITALAHVSGVEPGWPRLIARVLGIVIAIAGYAFATHRLKANSDN